MLEAKGEVGSTCVGLKAKTRKLGADLVENKLGCSRGQKRLNWGMLK